MDAIIKRYSYIVLFYFGQIIVQCHLMNTWESWINHNPHGLIIILAEKYSYPKKTKCIRREFVGDLLLVIHYSLCISKKNDRFQKSQIHLVFGIEIDEKTAKHLALVDRLNITVLFSTICMCVFENSCQLSRWASRKYVLAYYEAISMDYYHSGIVICIRKRIRIMMRMIWWSQIFSIYN